MLSDLSHYLSSEIDLGCESVLRAVENQLESLVPPEHVFLTIVKVAVALDSKTLYVPPQNVLVFFSLPHGIPI